jgi:hypothetical protein
MKSIINRPVSIAVAAAMLLALGSCGPLDPTGNGLGDDEQDALEYELGESGYTLISGREASGDVVVPDTVSGHPVVAIAENAFRDSAVVSVTLPSSVLRIGSYAFMGCASLATADLGSGVTELPVGAFYGCAALESVTLPDALVSVGENAFNACASLAALDLGDRLATMAYRAVSGCDALVRLELPASLTRMDPAAVVSCDELVEIVMLASTPPTVDGSGAAVTDCAKLTSIFVPSSAVDAYKAAAGWRSNASCITAIAD